MAAALTDSDRAVLTIAAAHYRAQGHRLEAARSTLELGSVAFYAAVNRLIDDPAANLEQPTVCARLRRVRDAERARRAA